MNQINNSDVVDGILDNMKNHVSTLQDKLSIAGMAVTKSQTVNEKITIMKEYQDKVATLNSCWRSKNRHSLVANLQHENRHMLALEEENRQLRFALKELEDGMHLIMNDYRRVFSGFIRSDLLYDLVKHSSMNFKCSLDIDKFVQISRISDKCMRAAEQKFEDYEDTITELRCENEALRDILLRLPHSKEIFTTKTNNNSRKNSIIHLKNNTTTTTTTTTEVEKTPKASNNNNNEEQSLRKDTPSKIPKMSYQWPVHKSKDRLIDEVRILEAKSRSKSSNDVGKIIYSTDFSRNSTITTTTSTFVDGILKDKSKSTGYILSASSTNNNTSQSNSSALLNDTNNKKIVFRPNNSMDGDSITPNLGSIECCSVDSECPEILSNHPTKAIDEAAKENDSFKITMNSEIFKNDLETNEIFLNNNSTENEILEDENKDEIDLSNLTTKEANGHLNSFCDESPSNTIKKNSQKEICIN